MNHHIRDHLEDKQVVRDANKVLDGTSKKNPFARLLPFLGPAFIASIAYVDPGNFATNISGGAKFGFMLLWVIMASNLMAILIQSLAAKLGIATGKNLAEHCREAFPRPVVIALWVMMELVAMSTDVAEFIGAALGFNLLLGIPLWAAGLMTAVATFAILSLQRFGFRPLEAVITAFVGVVAIAYVVETILVKPDWSLVAYHTFVPQFSGPQSIVLAAGILGATIMPHAIFLHSALTQNRIVVRDPQLLKKLFHFEMVDVLVAMGVASSVNAAMLIMSASTFYNQGLSNIGTIEQAYRTLQPLLGSAASLIFAISLLASGLSSASVGTMAGQVIMQGFIKRDIPVWLRRGLTMLPSLVILFLGLEPTHVLVISQVFLSFGLPFTIIPLVIFTSQKERMGILANSRFTTCLAALVAALVVALNIYLLYSIFFGG